jgi:hypothetical protein
MTPEELRRARKYYGEAAMCCEPVTAIREWDDDQLRLVWKSLTHIDCSAGPPAEIAACVMAEAARRFFNE